LLARNWSSLIPTRSKHQYISWSGTPVAFDQSAGELKEEEKVAGDELVGEEEVDPFLQPHLHGAGWTVIKGGMLPSFVRRPKNSVPFHPCD
jgi:hypothetical protein